MQRIFDFNIRAILFELKFFLKFFVVSFIISVSFFAIISLDDFRKDDAKTEAALIMLGYIGDVYAESRFPMQLDDDFRVRVDFYF